MPLDLAGGYIPDDITVNLITLITSKLHLSAFTSVERCDGPMFRLGKSWARQILKEVVLGLYTSSWLRDVRRLRTGI